MPHSTPELNSWYTLLNLFFFHFLLIFNSTTIRPPAQVRNLGVSLSDCLSFIPQGLVIIQSCWLYPLSNSQTSRDLHVALLSTALMLQPPAGLSTFPVENSLEVGWRGVRETSWGLWYQSRWEKKGVVVKKRTNLSDFSKTFSSLDPSP